MAGIAFIRGQELRFMTKTKCRRISDLSDNFEIYLFISGNAFVEPEIQRKVHRLYRCPTLELPVFGKYPNVLIFYIYATIRIFTERKNISIIYSTPNHSSIYAFAAKKLLNKKWVVDLWDFPGATVVKKSFPEDRLYALGQWSLRNTIPRADLVIIGIVPASLASYRIPPDKQFHVTNGTDLEIFDRDRIRVDRRENTFELLLIESALPGSGMEVLLDAVDNLRQNIPEIRLSLVGFVSDKDQEDLKKEIVSRGLEDNVDNLGPKDPEELPYFIARADVCLITFPRMIHRDETYPLKLFDYLAMGKPVVSTDLTGIREIIKDGWNGILAEPDDPESLAEAINTIYSNPEIRDNLKINAPVGMEKYDWRVINSKIIQRIGALIE